MLELNDDGPAALELELDVPAVGCIAFVTLPSKFPVVPAPLVSPEDDVPVESSPLNISDNDRRLVDENDDEVSASCDDGVTIGVLVVMVELTNIGRLI